jgi:hypothetical protein
MQLFRKPVWIFALFHTLLINSLFGDVAAKEPAAFQPRDWTRHPAIVELTAAPMLYALGDVHGDCDRMLELLAVQKLIAAVPQKPQEAVWAGGKAVLVITGDMIDKGDQSISVISALRALEPQAETAGGRLIICLGNHEAEFLAFAGEKSKTAEFSAELKRAGIVAQDVAAGRDSAGIGVWMRNLPAGAKVGAWFFCHAGNTHGKTLADLESELEKEITAHGYSTPLLIDPDSMLEARMHPRPWWEGDSDPSLHDVKKPKFPRKHENENPIGNQVRQAALPPRLLACVTALGATHLVIGHQPHKTHFPDGTTREAGQMFAHYDGLFFMIDTGMSRGADGGRGALLLIREDGPHVAAVALYADGKSVVLWQK